MLQRSQPAASRVHRDRRALHRVGALVACAVMAPAAPAVPQTVDTILACHLERRGGEALDAVRSVRMTGRMNVGGLPASFALETRRGRQARLELEIQGLQTVVAYDGENGWAWLPMKGQIEPEILAGDSLHAIRAWSDLDGPLAEAVTSGTRPVLVGREKIDGHDTFRLKISRPGGEETWSHLDSETCLEVRRRRRMARRGAGAEVLTRYSDYRAVDGILVAHRVEMAVGNPPVTSSYDIETVEWNVELSDDRFALPRNVPDHLDPNPKEE